MGESGISVIITAYNRREFLADAINSVLHQTLDGFPFEIVVISNFHVDVSRFNTSCEIRAVLMDGSMGEFLYKGLNTAKYDILAFLDDDDTFDPGKLMRLTEIFSSNPGLCYYHNDVKYVDRYGYKIDYVRLVEKKSRTSISKDLIFDAKSNLSAIKAALENRGDFNLSSMAIRRDCYLKYLLLLKQIKSNPDGFFFWMGIISKGQLMIDSKKLTNYRIHEMNVTGQLNFMSKGQELQKQIYTFDLILNFLAVNKDPYNITEVIRKWVFLFKFEYELMSAIFTNSSRVGIMILIKRLLSMNVKYTNTLKYRVLLLSVIAILNRDFAQNFYIKVGNINQKTKSKYE